MTIYKRRADSFRNGSYSRTYTQTTSDTSSKQFFIKLSLEHSEQPANIFAPAQSYDGFKRKYLRVYVHNNGLSDANNCTAELKVLKTGDLKQLCWDGIPLLSDPFNKSKIRINDKAILHIVFSDSRSHENFVFIPTMESLANPNIRRLEDAYTSEELDLELTIRSDGGAYCKARILIPPYNDFLSIRMKIISQESSHIIWQKLKAKLHSYLS
jgi:hypothetical protein